MPLPYEGSQPFVFVSYAHKDAPRVLPLLRRMQAEGYRVWFDEGIAPGRTYTGIISSHIADCYMLLAFYSHSYRESDMCMNEMNLAASKRKPALIVNLQDAMPDDEVMLLYGRSQFIHCGEDMDEGGFAETVARCHEISACRCSSDAHVAPISDPTPVLPPAAAASEADVRNLAAPEDCVVENGVLRAYNGTAPVVRLPEGITEIGERAFADHHSLAWLFLPQSLQRIGKESFAGCIHLQKLFVPDAVTVIGVNAFKDCIALRMVLLSKELRELHNGAFFHCRSLKKIWLPDGVKELRGGTFAGCTALETVYLPEDTQVAEKAFANCAEGLQRVTRTVR